MSGTCVTGWPTLTDALGPVGPAVVAKVTEWLDVPESSGPVSASAAADPAAGPVWPARPDDAAFHGLAGEIVRAIEPVSEADPVALLVQLLVFFGVVIGRAAHFLVEGDRHYANEFVVLVGSTSKGRKGTSAGRIIRLFTALLESGGRLVSGLSSGEGLVWSVRDPIEKQERVREKGGEPRYETVVADPGEPDKRLLVLEPEFANVLKQTERQGNTLSAVLRQAWETGDLRTMTKNNPAKATGAHVGIVGHITAAELLRNLSETESANGFANRFMWFLVKRSKLLPEGGQADPHLMSHLEERLTAAVEFASGVGEVRRDPEARELWHAAYAELSGDRPGLAGCLLGRAEAHVMRLAMIYALLDCSGTIRADHLLAALALWEYAEQSVLYVFGDGLGDPLADDLLRFIRAAGTRGVTRTDIAHYLGRNAPADKVNRALMLLARHHLAEPRKEQTGGAPAERWFALGRA